MHLRCRHGAGHLLQGAYDVRQWRRLACGQHTRRRCLQVRLMQPRDSGEELAAEFSQYVNKSGISEPLRYKRPTPMIPPNAAVQSIMTALQMNDYPDEDSGIRAAYLFSKPYQCESLIAGQGTPERVRCWAAAENWLNAADFAAMLHASPYKVLLGCPEWKATSQVVFPSQRMENKALQTVEVKTDSSRAQPFTFTFCLERIDAGPYKGCWLVVGLREGDYTHQS